MTDHDARETRTAGTCARCGAPLPSGDYPCAKCTETIDDASAAQRPTYTGPRRVASYVILREIGSGGMGTVFEAFDEAMGRKVALKVLSRQHSLSARAGARFAQEAWIAGKLSHPNLVKVHDRGTWEDLSYYAMELVEGGSLAEVLSNMRRWGRDDRLGLEFKSPRYVRWAVEQVIATAGALDHAHRHGVVHRDVKPLNLLLDRELGVLKVTDFGLAIDSEATRLTTEGKLLGTLLYMAPEQILGKQREIDARTDIYALGVTLFELLTLELPYTGKSQELYLNAVLTTEARKASRLNRHVGRDLEIVIHKALEKDPRDRYASAADLAADLGNVLSLRPIQAVPPGRLDRVWKWVRRKPVHAALVGIVVVTVPVLGVLTDRALDQRRLSRQVTLDRLVERMNRLEQRGDDPRIVEAASEVLRLDPDEAYARRARSVSAARVSVELREGDPAGATAAERMAIDDAALLVERFPQAAWPYTLQALVLSILGRDDEASRARALAEERAGGDPSDLDLHLGALNALDAGDPERAVTLLSTVIARRPDSESARRDRAEAYARLGRLKEAIEDYSIAAALNPQDPLTRFNLARLLTKVGRYDEAAQFLQGVKDLGAVANVGLSANLLAQGGAAQGDEALALFQEAEREARAGLALDRTLPWLHINLGASLMEQQRLAAQPDEAAMAEATRSYEQALKSSDGRDPKSKEVHDTAVANLCDLLIQSSDPERALEICGEAVELFPTNPVAFYNLAGVHAQMGRADEALAALERDFELGDRDWQYLSEDAWFASLRADPRFLALVERMRSGSSKR
jgi:tetratricopeptide (TPR) repeat protein